MLSDYTIRLSNEAQKEQHLRAAYGSWNRGRTWEVYMEDQKQCVRGAQDAWANNGALQSWVLVKRDDFDGPIYAGCETFRRESFYKDLKSGEVKDGFSYGLTMVVTPEEHRKKGFATHFLRLLHYQLGSPSSLPPFPTSEWGPPSTPLTPEQRAAIPHAIASVLWSDVGSKFYEQVTIGPEWPGWVVRDEECQQIVWKLKPVSASAEKKERNWIYTRDLPSIGKYLSQAARKRMSQADSPTPTWSADPASPGLLNYVPSRTLRPRSEDWRAVYDSEPCGIRLPSSTLGKEGAIVLFVFSPKIIGRAVLIQCIHNLDPGQLPALLEVLDEVGAQVGVEEGWVWGISPDSPLGKAWLGLEGRVIRAGRRAEVDGHLLGVAWYGSPETRASLVDTQMWSWC